MKERQLLMALHPLMEQAMKALVIMVALLG